MMGFLIQVTLALVAIFIGFNFGTVGMCIGAPIIFFTFLNDSEDFDFFRKEEQEEDEEFI